MNKEKDYASDSDQSDEDFCPEKAALNSEPASEEDDSVDDDDEENPDDSQKKRKITAKNRKTLTKNSKRIKNVKKDEDDDESEAEIEEFNNSTRRLTRQTDGTNNIGTKSKLEKNKLEESDTEDKSRSDALWADFLSDVTPTANVKKTNTNTIISAKSSSSKEPSTTSHQSKKSELSQESKGEKSPSPKQITITEIVDFAGEEVRLEKTVNSDSIKENKATKLKAPIAGVSPRGNLTSHKRSIAGGGGSGGVSSLLNQIGKKKKLSVLEKSQLDWSSFKEHEGIEEELRTHNKGKDGFLERQDFLQRTDLRQFEIEKNLRQTRRTN